MTHWPGQPGPDDGRRDPGNPQNYPAQWPPAGPQPGSGGTYRQPWATPAPQQPPGPPPTAPPAGYPPPPTGSGPGQPWTQSPAPGQPWAAQPPAGGPPGWQSPLTPSGPPKSRNRVILAVVVVLLLAAGGFLGYRVYTGAGVAGIGATKSLAPKDVAQQYLEALAAGDAQKALSYGNSQPGNTDFLTDEVLRKQIAKSPLSNIRVIDEDTSMNQLGMSKVHVAVTFGSTVDDVDLGLKKDGSGVWKLEKAAVKLGPAPGGDNDKSRDTITVFGKKFDGAIYVFPGFLQVGSSNEYLDVKTDPVSLKALSAYDTSYLDAKVSLNEAGSQAISEQLTAAFANCERSRSLAPPGCPTKLDGYDAQTAIDGSVTWGKADFSEVKIGSFNEYDMTVPINGEVTQNVDFQTTDSGPRQGVVRSYLYGNADITTSPPKIKMS